MLLNLLTSFSVSVLGVRSNTLGFHGFSISLSLTLWSIVSFRICLVRSDDIFAAGGLLSLASRLLFLWCRQGGFFAEKRTPQYVAPEPPVCTQENSWLAGPSATSRAVRRAALSFICSLNPIPNAVLARGWHHWIPVLLIRVPSDGSQVAREQPPDLRLGDGVEVLAELPPNSPFLFLVLARWDDVVGPQALFVWLPKLRGAAPHASLSRRVIYVTGHAVTCMSDTFEVGASSLSAVPDLGIAFVARQFRDDAGEAYAIAAAADHAKLDFLHSRFALVQDWLQRLADKMGPQIHQFEDDVVLGSDVTPYVLDFSYAVSTMREDSIEFSPHQEDWYGKDLFKYPAIAQALTSHLQTFGQSVVIGDNRALVNSLISFLSLFLDDEQRKRSRYVPSHGYTCFHMGLCLQGLLISGYGYRPISSDELNANPLPVTTIDFTRSIENGAVRQTEPLHKRMLGKSANFEPRSMLNPVRESVRMVTNLIEELQLLPCSQWRGHIAIFNKRLDKLAESAVCHVRRSTGTNVKEELRKMLCVDERELTIVAARAERMRPGVFVHIFGAKLNANN